MRHLPANLARAAAALAIALILALSATSQAGAIGFVVNSPGDTSDLIPGDTTCADLLGACTLRAAIQETNALLGPDTISFNIGGGGVQTISPGSPLPALTDLLTIDGRTQPGYSGTPLIEIDGSGAGSGADGLTLSVNGVTIEGLAVNRFGRFGIVAQNAADATFANTITANFVGLDPTGTIDRGNGDTGIEIASTNTFVTDNVASGNGNYGILVAGSGSAGVSGNYVGTNAAGTAAIPNASGGVGFVSGTLQNNVISGNGGFGVAIAFSEGATITNNRIGVAADGLTPLGNAGDGVVIAISTGITVTGNTIAYNNGRGICVCTAPTSSALGGNSLFNNSGLGIDLGPVAGVTANDAGDADTGTNGYQNYPVLTSVTSSGGTTTVMGTLNTTPDTNVVLEFDVSPACDPSGYGEGAGVLGLIALATTDASGNYTINRTFSTSVATGQAITALATTADGTSEFSKCVFVNCPGSTGGWNIPAGDSDCDGFSDSRESFTGTDPTDWCASTPVANDEPVPDVWPVDFDDNQRVTILDVSKFSVVFGSSAPGPPYAVRYDFNGDNKITILDVSQYSNYYGKSCMP